MLPKLIIVVLLLGAIVSLFSALYYMLRGTGDSSDTLRMLKLRVAFSVSMILFLLIAAKLGWIHPHGLGR
jgi:NADH:ubiquinone oxidoreductase subunit 6 (subunit J)